MLGVKIVDNYENYLKYRGVVLPDPDSCGVPNYLQEVLIDRKEICALWILAVDMAICFSD